MVAEASASMSCVMMASCWATATASEPIEPTFADTAASMGAATLALAATAPAIGAVDPSSVADGSLLNVDVDLAADLDLAAPAIGAAVSANVGSIGSDAVAVAQQDAIITQDIDADASATTDQTSDIQQ